MVLHNVLGAAVMYDTEKQETFKVARQWIEEVRRHTDQAVPVVLVGRDPGPRAVPELEVLEYLYKVRVTRKITGGSIERQHQAFLR